MTRLGVSLALVSGILAGLVALVVASPWSSAGAPGSEPAPRAGDAVAAGGQPPAPDPSTAAPSSTLPPDLGRTVVSPAPIGTPEAAGTRSAPVRIEVPSLGISSSLVRLGLNPDGTLEVPTDYGLAGWFTGAAAPGAPGPAIIAGHVDSKTGPAVFYRLREMRPGQEVLVTREDGVVVRFVVTQLQQFPKASFPTESVYGPSAEPVLRLITCGGGFDRSERSYTDNIIVSARLA